MNPARTSICYVSVALRNKVRGRAQIVDGVFFGHSLCRRENQIFRWKQRPVGRGDTVPFRRFCVQKQAI